MGNSRYTHREEAGEKIKLLTKEIKNCTFCTHDTERLAPNPICTQHIDEDGNIWFLCDKNALMGTKGRRNMSLIYKQGRDGWLVIHGRISISIDNEKKLALWDARAASCFDGISDPGICLVKLTCYDGYYWNSKQGRIERMVKKTTVPARKIPDEYAETEVANTTGY